MMFAFYSDSENELLGYGHSYLPCDLVKYGNKHNPHAHGVHFCGGYPAVITYSLETGR